MNVNFRYNRRTNNIFRRLGMPGPAPIPFFGDIFSIIHKGLNKYDMDLIQKYGKVIGLSDGKEPTILVSDPDLLRNVLIKDSHLFINRYVIRGISGPFEHGLLTLQDEEWKNARTIVSPTFSTAKLKSMYNLMDEVSDMYNKRLLDYADKQEIFDVKVLNGQYTLDNIATCLFGVETNSLQNENVILINHLKKFFTVDFVKTSISILIVLISTRLASYLSKKGYSFLPSDAVDYTSCLVNQILSRRRQHLERRNDFIQIMVDHEEEMKCQEQEKTLTKSIHTLNDKEIVGQALVFMVAGYETTSVLMSFFFYVMSTEPIIQEKIYEEIRNEIGDNKITHENLHQLRYLDMVISETLRMYPPFIRFDRVASEDYQLGNYHIPKGSIIHIPVYPIHHDSKVWPDPDKFIPERFTSTEKAKRHPMTYLAFGAGPRNCIGMRFALLEAKLGIAKALRLIEIQKCEKTEVPLQLSKFVNLNSTNGIWVRVVRRSE
ncbi:unnamed protein product [Adineta steineri]|uniref:Cytochrome P450 n=1 Tax=Adineta steineri TaxID=433720 RepID=A0A815K487_9BILA|nr:unnamed protein product [Adineta steineri]CAF1486172.1 unnamed protein product [Adineta steineri]